MVGKRSELIHLLVDWSFALSLEEMMVHPCDERCGSPVIACFYFLEDDHFIRFFDVRKGKPSPAFSLFKWKKTVSVRWLEFTQHCLRHTCVNSFFLALWKWLMVGFCVCLWSELGYRLDSLRFTNAHLANHMEMSSVPVRVAWQSAASCRTTHLWALCCCRILFPWQQAEQISSEETLHI